MPKSRQLGEDGVVVRSYAVTHPPDLHLPRQHFADWHQLVHCVRGVAEVRTDQASWVVPPHRAVWVPAGVHHGVRLPGQVQLRTVFVHVDLAEGRPLPDDVRVVDVSRLLRELVLEVCRRSVLGWHDEVERSLAVLLLDRLVTRDEPPLRLPWPLDPRARRVAEAVSTQPAQLARALAAAGASRRTVERLFQREAGMSLGRWVRRARVLASLRRLARGDAVTEVAEAAGYRSTSAFIAAFRAEVGRTPGAWR